jgi:hypothetical protein
MANAFVPFSNKVLFFFFRWLLLVATELFHPRSGYFRACPDNPIYLEPDPDTVLIDSDNEYAHIFRLAGRLLAFTARLRLPLPAPINLAALRFYLDAPILLKDLDQVSPPIFRYKQ